MLFFPQSFSAWRKFASEIRQIEMEWMTHMYLFFVTAAISHPKPRNNFEKENQEKCLRAGEKLVRFLVNNKLSINRSGIDRRVEHEKIFVVISQPKPRKEKNMNSPCQHEKKWTDPWLTIDWSKSTFEWEQKNHKRTRIGIDLRFEKLMVNCFSRAWCRVEILSFTYNHTIILANHDTSKGDHCIQPTKITMFYLIRNRSWPFYSLERVLPAQQGDRNIANCADEVNGNNQGAVCLENARRQGTISWLFTSAALQFGPRAEPEYRRVRSLSENLARSNL